MNRILKITDGAMKGAEIALVNGMRVKVGSSDVCDVVIQDASWPAEAFQLDASPSAVTLLAPGQEPRVLEDCEVVEIGTAAIAVGPADEPWGPLVRREQSAERATGGEREAVAAEPSVAAPAETAPEGDAGESPAPAEDPPAEEPPAEESRPCERRGCLFWILLLLLLAAGAAACVWFFRDSLAPHAGKFRPVARAVGAGGAWCRDACWRPACGWMAKTWRGWFPDKAAEASRIEAARPKLSEVAADHGLRVGEKDGSPFLSGNLARRTERLAVRALALAANARTQFDLTDDETLRAAAEELLFAVTEGALTVFAATNRHVEIAGYVPSKVALEHALRALDADVAAVRSVDATRVAVGGDLPEKVERTAFVRNDRAREKEALEVAVRRRVATLPFVPEDRPVPSAKTVEKTVEKTIVVREVAARAAAPAAKARAEPAFAPAVAGILTQPYRCVVLGNGTRCFEGAALGDAVIEKIEADRLVLRRGNVAFTWVP